MRTFALALLAMLFAFPGLGSTKRITVAADGSGDYRSITEAVKAAPNATGEETIIYIKKGVYREKVFIDRPNITLLGESRKETQIVYPILWEKWEAEYKAKKDTTFEIRWGCATVNINAKANDCSILNLTVYNNYGSTVEKTRNHQFAVFGRATRTIILSCDILSDGSDDLSLWNRVDGMYYHADCYFRCPGVDFVCPRGWCFVENCAFEGAEPAQIWHDGSGGKSQKFVIKHSSFDAIEPSWLGRFHKDHQLYLISCRVSDKIIDKPIGYAYNDRQMDLQYGQRVYYYDVTRVGGTFEWMKDNLHTAEGSPKPEDITPLWTFDGKWDPMPKVRVLRKLF